MQMLTKRRNGDQRGPLISVPEDRVGTRKSSRLLNLSDTELVGSILTPSRFRRDNVDENHLNNSSLPKHLSIDKLDFQLTIRPTPLARHRTAQLLLEVRKVVKNPRHPLKIVFVAALAALYLPLLAGSVT